MTHTIDIKNLRQLVHDLLPKLVTFRNDLHQHPELCWEEFRTTQKIQTMLKENGVENIATPLSTGLVVDFSFHKDAPFVLLRAELDALPIQDEKTVSYRSRVKGICHACGHDAHCTVMLGLAILLKRSGIVLPFNIRFVFQPAEEPIPCGAPKMIKHGVLDNVTYALGMHVEPGLPIGTIALTQGWINMQSIRLQITITGKGGHSARPYETSDIIWIGSRVIQDTYQMIYRKLNWLETPVMLTFTQIHSAEGYNIIPRKMELTGTLRLANQKVKRRLINRITKRLNHLAEETDCKIHLKTFQGAPPVVNHPPLVNKMRHIALNNFWLPITIVNDYRSPGGDDFGFYSQKVPAVMVRFGIKNIPTQPGLHTGKFDVPGELIEIALSFFLHQLIHLHPDDREE